MESALAIAVESSCPLDALLPRPPLGDFVTDPLDEVLTLRADLLAVDAASLADERCTTDGSGPFGKTNGSFGVTRRGTIGLVAVGAGCGSIGGERVATAAIELLCAAPVCDMGAVALGVGAADSTLTASLDGLASRTVSQLVAVEAAGGSGLSADGALTLVIGCANGVGDIWTAAAVASTSSRGDAVTTSDPAFTAGDEGVSRISVSRLFGEDERRLGLRVERRGSADRLSAFFSMRALHVRAMWPTSPHLKQASFFGHAAILCLVDAQAWHCGF